MKKLLSLALLLTGCTLLAPDPQQARKDLFARITSKTWIATSLRDAL